jgi:hypothetical protein
LLLIQEAYWVCALVSVLSLALRYSSGYAGVVGILRNRMFILIYSMMKGPVTNLTFKFSSLSSFIFQMDGVDMFFSGQFYKLIVFRQKSRIQDAPICFESSFFL